MKFARLIQQYKYDLTTWNKKGNLGDCIQNLAVENLYKEMGIENLLKINRDEISKYNGEKVILPMQGWFGNVHGVFAAKWSKDVIPVFIGFHLNDYQNCREQFVEDKIYEQMKNFEPIGCRDRNTRDFLKNLGVNAYFSGCLTLTFPKREKEPANGKIFLVDIPEDVKTKLPSEIRDSAEEISHNYYFKKYPVTFDEANEFENAARKLLEKYKTEAKLVITPRIHCAMPCIAMGIPVILINKNVENCRLDVLDGIIPKYSPSDISIIDWNPKAPDIEELKLLIKENAKLRILNKVDKNLLEQLNKKTEELYKIGQKFTSNTHKHLLKQIKDNNKIIFWGASLFLKEFLTKYHIKNSNILGIIDKNTNLQGTNIGAYEIFAPEKLAELKPDVVICSIRNNHECIYPIVKEFMEENYPNIKLVENIFEW